ncbi:MAG: bifunctional folylpolyglutamate synthase/dihydrofolate synthase [Kiritimatiellia bacterium]|jgi:dihydrofolate synthase/folylpolyglutamate synthase
MKNQKRIERIFARRAFGIKPGLETTLALLERLDHPERGLAVVHIAGTNGKGSVAALIASVLTAAGFKSGLYTSPHLVRLNERFKIDGVEVPDDELHPLLEEVETAALRVELDGGAPPTFFECMTALALLWFSRQGVHIATVETGMGGRLDATNVLRPLVSVITRIGLDHTVFLGDTLEKIALEKAGIVKFAAPVVCGAMPDEALAAIAATAKTRGSRLVRADETVSVRRLSGDLHVQRLAVASAEEDYGAVPLALAASYQVENVATAVAAIEAAGEALSFPFDRKTVARGLASAEWPGRFQCVGGQPDVLVDGAHNPDGAAALVRALRDAGCGRRLRFVAGQCSDKDAEGFFRVIAPVCGRVWTVPLSNPRSTAPEALAAVARRHGLEAVPCASLEEGLASAKADALAAGETVVVCGSLFLVGEALEAIR